MSPVSTSVAAAVYTTVLTAAFSATVAVPPEVITGASFTGVTVTVTVWLAESLPSEAVTVKVSVPLKSFFGV